MMSSNNQYKDYAKDHQADHILDSIKKVIKTGNYESDDDIIVLTEVADNFAKSSNSQNNQNYSNSSYKFNGDINNPSAHFKESFEENKSSLNHSKTSNINSKADSASFNNFASKNSEVSSEINIIRDFGKNIDQAANGKTLANDSLESFLNKLIQPQITKWLDENLPEITEKVIQQHIEKLLSHKLK